MTASPSDRPSQSLLLCHGLGSASSRRSPCGLRHRGPAPPSEALPLVPPPLCDLSGVRPRPRLLRGALPDPGPPPLGAGRQGPPSTQSGWAPRSPGPSTHLSRPVPREGSHIPPPAPGTPDLHARDDSPAPAPVPPRCVVCGRVSRWLIPARWPRVDRRRGDDHARAARRDPTFSLSASTGRSGPSPPPSASTMRRCAPRCSTKRAASGGA